MDILPQQPDNYAGPFASVPQPGQAFTQGLQSGAGLQQVQQQQLMQQVQLQRMRQMQQSAMQVAQNPTPESIAQLSIAFPEMSEQFKRSYDMLTPTQQRSDLDHMSQVYAAVQNGRPDIASDLLNQRADAVQNSGGDPAHVQAARTMAQLVSQNPDNTGFIQTLIGGHIAAAMGPEKFADTFNSLNPINQQKLQADANQASATAAALPGKLQAETAKLNTDATTAAGRLALDRDTLMSNTQLKLKELGLQYGMPDESSRKLINDAALGAATQEQSASRLNGLADKIEQAKTGYGVGGNAADVWNRAFGTENGTTALKQEMARQINNTAIEQLKGQLGGGGRFTDTDMKAALSNVPDSNSDPSLIASYFRGMAKLQSISAAQQNAQAEWLSQTGKNGHLGPAPHDLTIMGTKVPAGTTYADFSREFAQKKAEQIEAQSALARAGDKSYMRFAQPGGATPTGASQVQSPSQPSPGAAWGGGVQGAD